MKRLEVWTVDELSAASLDQAAVRCLPRFREQVRERLRLTPLAADAPVPVGADTLIVVGGGTLIDEAKHWRFHERPELRLIAVPTIWGSGAEISPVAVLTRDGEKEIELDDALRPDVRVSWPELVEALPDWRARDACADVWSHALEGFLSPLADDALRGEIAGIMRTMLELELGNDPRWFDPSARACSAQGRASVGLVHGIAHTLEGPLRGADEGHPFGHARLCAVFLWPVLCFNRDRSRLFDDYMDENELDGAAVLAVARSLFIEPAYDRALPTLEEKWRTVLRDPCSRTNSALVRPDAIEFFRERRFL